MIFLFIPFLFTPHKTRVAKPARRAAYLTHTFLILLPSREGNCVLRRNRNCGSKSQLHRNCVAIASQYRRISSWHEGLVVD